MRTLLTTFLVTNTNDSGAGSLRQAILDSNNASGPDTVSFDIPFGVAGHLYYRDDGVSGTVSNSKRSQVPAGAASDPDLLNPLIVDAGPNAVAGQVNTIDPDWIHSWWSTRLATGLPTITGSLTIDGFTQPGSQANSLAVGDSSIHRVELDVNRLGWPHNGLAFSSSANTVRGMVVNQSLNGAIAFTGGGGNIVAGNFVGTDISGLIARSGTNIGVSFWLNTTGVTTQNRIGGTAPADRNVLVATESSNGTNVALRIRNDFNLYSANLNTVIQGNYIGTNAGGTRKLSGLDGIGLTDTSNVLIGGTEPGAGNVLSGLRTGIDIGGHVGALNNVVQGNYIGLDATGSYAIGNSLYGITDGSSSRGTLIGGTDADDGQLDGIVRARNVISGNEEAIRTSSSSTSANPTRVQGNYIGTDATGTYAVRNGYGISPIGTNILIGGTQPGAGNLISGNTYGISKGIFYGDTGRRIIQGNLIGTNAAGTAAIPNSIGILLGYTGNYDNIIGGNTPESRNIISGNTLGIGLSDSSALVQGNFIGTDITGTQPLGNGTGIRVSGGYLPSERAVIGGLNSSESNRIAYSRGNGIEVGRDSIDTVAILGNSIHSNQVLGIDLIARHIYSADLYGPTPNDSGDGDVGANGLQNFPVIASAMASSSQIQIQGSLNSTPNSQFRIEFFANDTVDGSGFGEGQHLIGFADVATDAFGNASFLQTGSGDWRGAHIAATATLLADRDGNPATPLEPIATSEFSGTHAVTTVTYTLNVTADGAGAGTILSTPGAISYPIISMASFDPDTEFALTATADSGSVFTGWTGAVVSTSPTIQVAMTEDLNLVAHFDLLPANEAPYFTSTPIESVLESTPYLYSISTADPDVTDTRTITASVLPDWMTLIDSGDGTATLSGNPEYSDVGSHTVILAVTDSFGVSVEQQFTIDVTTTRVQLELSGMTFLDWNNDGLQDDNDAGLEGVMVSLFNEANLTTPVAITTTASDGTYHFAELIPAGIYRLVESQPSDFLDGRETAGSYGGSVDNTQDNNAIGSLSFSDRAVVATGYNFAELPPSGIQGLVYADINDDGSVSLGETGISGVLIHLTGRDDRGQVVDRVTVTDSEGLYQFDGLRPSDFSGYAIAEKQPEGFTDGRETVGTIDGVQVGNAVDNAFSDIRLMAGLDGVNYNFGERPAPASTLHSGQTATIGFWHNRNGQNLILSLNGGPSSTQLGNWLASTFANLYGENAGVNNLTDKTNAQVASYFIGLFRRTSALNGPPKVEAQVLATAFAVYVTNRNLAGLNAAANGFEVSTTGTGAATIDIGSSNRAAFGLSPIDSTVMTVMDTLVYTNSRSRNGLLYDLDSSGTISSDEKSLRTLINTVFTAINESGDI